MTAPALQLSFKVPSERLIAREIEASGLGRMQAIRRIQQREAFLAQAGGR